MRIKTFSATLMLYSHGLQEGKQTLRERTRGLRAVLPPPRASPTGAKEKEEDYHTFCYIKLTDYKLVIIKPKSIRVTKGRRVGRG